MHTVPLDTIRSECALSLDINEPWLSTLRRRVSVAALAATTQPTFLLFSFVRLRARRTVDRGVLVRT